ncbi:hypothetical protein GCM10025864_36300 [Luteimicrobium album]|uniref:Preprotein translocase subunit YajC n=1 Tax=Luteimicrobium album TaxID=1054550 RepID=A0ABQ6I559_9MICO|nr:preprotein translocase subunit YajC [Luteimicrobium album]GMA25871.1 hypothetical protein GCM10025864_36300 [Luteimicrobium album]
MQHIHAAVEAANSGSSGGSNYTFLIILLVLLVGLFFLSRRTQRKQKDAQSFRANLTPGQDVMTASGMLGRIVEVDGDEITIESTPEPVRAGCAPPSRRSSNRRPRPTRRP